MEEVAALLEVVEKCAGHSGKLNAIANEAMGRLLEINEECRKQGAERAAKAAAEREEADAESARLAAEQADADAETVDDDGPKAIPSNKYTQADTARRL